MSGNPPGSKWFSTANADRNRVARPVTMTDKEHAAVIAEAKRRGLSFAAAMREAAALWLSTPPSPSVRE